MGSALTSLSVIIAEFQPDLQHRQLPEFLATAPHAAHLVGDFLAAQELAQVVAAQEFAPGEAAQQAAHRAAQRPPDPGGRGHPHAALRAIDHGGGEQAGCVEGALDEVFLGRPAQEQPPAPTVTVGLSGNGVSLGGVF